MQVPLQGHVQVAVAVEGRVQVPLEGHVRVAVPLEGHVRVPPIPLEGHVRARMGDARPGPYLSLGVGCVRSLRAVAPPVLYKPGQKKKGRLLFFSLFPEPQNDHKPQIALFLVSDSNSSPLFKSRVLPIEPRFFDQGRKAQKNRGQSK